PGFLQWLAPSCSSRCSCVNSEDVPVSPGNAPVQARRTTPPLADRGSEQSQRPICKPMRPPATRHAGALRDSRAWYRYWIILGVIFALSVFFAVATLVWDNPMPVGSEGFWLISKMRLVNLFIILIVAFCQSLATVSFQTITNNRIITPSIMGFEIVWKQIGRAHV